MKTRQTIAWLCLIGTLGAGSAFGREVLTPLITQPVPLQETPVPASVRDSAWAGELLKLVKAGIDQEVMLSFVDTAGPFQLDAEGIIYLRDLGVSSEVMAAVLRHDLELTAATKPITQEIPTSSRPELTDLLRFLRESRAKSPASSPPSSPTGVAAESTGGSGSIQTTSFSFVMDSGSPDVLQQFFEQRQAEEFAHPAALAPAPAPGPAPAALRGSSYPVREAVPRQLTNTIVMVQCYGPPPNLLIIELPDSQPEE